ncbi:hypothetical protein Tco_0540515 [Tanacetum coccineum]
MSASNQQTLADSGSNERPLMLDKENYISWENRVINYLLQAIPNDIYNLVDACKTAQEMWERIKRLMYGSDVTTHVRHSRLMDEFDKFAAMEGESLESMYERLPTLVNIMDRNNVRPITVSINTKFLNCLKPEWSKYVTMVRHNQTGDTVSYDQLYDSLVQFEPHIQASKAKIAAKNHDPLAIIAHSDASSSQFHASPSYLNSPQPYYVTHPTSVVDFEEDYQGELQGDSQEDKLTTAMMKTKQESSINAGNRNDESNRIFQRVPQTESNPGKANVQLITMARIQLVDDNIVTEPNYDAKVVSEVNASHKVHEQANHVKHKTIIQTSDDNQINSNIIFDDPYVENNGGTSEHDSNAHDQYLDIEIMAYNVQRETENQK